MLRHLAVSALAAYAVEVSDEPDQGTDSVRPDKRPHGILSRPLRADRRAGQLRRGGGGAGDTCGTGGLATLSNLQNATAGSDPSWITGDEDEPSTPATTQSRSTYTISGGRMQ